MFQTILVPLDGSRRAESILNHVENIALNSSAKVIFLRVVKPRYNHVADGTYRSWQNQEVWRKTKIAETYLSGLKGEFREKGIASVSHVSNGAIVKSIVRTAEKEDADLVAIASHYRKGLGRVLNGSVAAKVMTHTDRPVLIIHTNGDRL